MLRRRDLAITVFRTRTSMQCWFLGCWNESRVTVAEHFLLWLWWRSLLGAAPRPRVAFSMHARNEGVSSDMCQ